MKKVFITDYIKDPNIEQKIIGDKAKVICLNLENEKKIFQTIFKTQMDFLFGIQR